MAIFFNVQEVRDYLLVHGEVYTLRQLRRTGYDVAVTGSFRNMVVFANVYIRQVKPIYASFELNPYVKDSGLGDSEEWLRLAKNMHLPNAQLYLYHVRFLKRRQCL